MVVTECKFNPIKDKTPVDALGFVDLKSAMVNHAIPSQIADTEEDYNGIEDPQSIMGRPTDVFEAMEMQTRINSFEAKSPDADKEPE